MDNHLCLFIIHVTCIFISILISCSSVTAIIFNEQCRIRYRSTTPVILGESFTFFCISDYSRLQYYIIRNGIRKGERYFRCGDDIGNDTSTYDIQCEKNPFDGLRQIKVTIPNVTENEHLSEWRCGIIQRLKLTVQIPVSEPPLFSDSSEVYEGDSVSCTVTNVRPTATIDWYIDGYKVRNTTLINTTTQGNDTDLYTTTSSLTMYGVPERQYRNVSCSAHNIPERTPMSLSKQVQVLFNPGESPVIEGYTTGNILFASNDKLTLSCKIRKSSPLPTITWSCPGEMLRMRKANTTKLSISTIDLKVTRTINGRKCICTCKHTVGNFDRSTSVTFSVTGTNAVSASCFHAEMASYVVWIILVTCIAIIILLACKRKSCRYLRSDSKGEKENSNKNSNEMGSTQMAGPQMYEDVTYRGTQQVYDVMLNAKDDDTAVPPSDLYTNSP